MEKESELTGVAFDVDQLIIAHRLAAVSQLSLISAYADQLHLYCLLASAQVSTIYTFPVDHVTGKSPYVVTSITSST